MDFVGLLLLCLFVSIVFVLVVCLVLVCLVLVILSVLGSFVLVGFMKLPFDVVWIACIGRILVVVMVCWIVSSRAVVSCFVI